MHPYYAFSLARERVAEADRYRLAALARQQRPDRVGPVRRAIARAAFAVARAADDRLVSRELAIR